MALDQIPMSTSRPGAAMRTTHNHRHSNHLRKMALIGAHAHGSPCHHLGIETQFVSNSHPSSTEYYPAAASSDQTTQFLQRTSPQTGLLLPQDHLPNNFVGMLDSYGDRRKLQQVPQSQTPNSSFQLTNSLAEPVPPTPHLHKPSFGITRSLQVPIQASPLQSHHQYHFPQVESNASNASGSTTGTSLLPTSSTPSSSSPRVFGWMPRSLEDLKPVTTAPLRHQPARIMTPIPPSAHTNQLSGQHQTATKTRHRSVSGKSTSIPIHTQAAAPVSISIGSCRANGTEDTGSSPIRVSSSSSPSDSISSSSYPSGKLNHVLIPSVGSVQPVSIQNRNPQSQLALMVSRAHPNQETTYKIQRPPLLRRDAQVNSVSSGRTLSSSQNGPLAPILSTPSTPARSASSEGPACPAPIPPSPFQFRHYVPEQGQQQFYKNSDSQPVVVAPSQQSQFQPLFPLLNTCKIPRTGQKRKAARDLDEQVTFGRTSLVSHQSPRDSVASPISIPSRSNSPVAELDSGSFFDSEVLPKLPDRTLFHSSMTFLAETPNPSPASASSTAIASVASPSSTTTITGTPPSSSMPSSGTTPSHVLPSPSDFASIITSKTIAPHLLHLSTPASPARKKPRLDPVLPAPTVQELMLQAQKIWEEKETRKHHFNPPLAG